MPLQCSDDFPLVRQISAPGSQCSSHPGKSVGVGKVRTGEVNAPLLEDTLQNEILRLLHVLLLRAKTELLQSCRSDQRRVRHQITLAQRLDERNLHHGPTLPKLLPAVRAAEAVVLHGDVLHAAGPAEEHKLLEDPGQEHLDVEQAPYSEVTRVAQPQEGRVVLGGVGAQPEVLQALVDADDYRLPPVEQSQIDGRCTALCRLGERLRRR